MQIASFRIENYKSFRATEDVQLAPGFTVIVGQNNVGKTALVEALSLNFTQHLHRSLRTVPTAATPVRGNAAVSLRFQVSSEELLLLLSRFDNFLVPSQNPGPDAARAFSQIASGTNTLVTTWYNGALASARLESIPPTPGSLLAASLRVTVDGQIEATQNPLATVNESNRFEYQLANVIKAERVYAFDAERLHLGMSGFGTASALRPDAANLPEVLGTLERNRARFDRLGRLLHTILPAVRGISVQPRDGNQVEILVWPVDPDTERADLAIPLSECGTGIGQVVALLYVVLTADSSKVILIDEPQSFLHPGAVRKLIETLKEYSQHQFIITTHSPAALTAADPQTLLRLRIDDGETIIDRLDATEARDLRLVLADVGARLSDVFGADNILWVEGRTEELCFPKIVQRLTERRLLGTAIVGVLHTAEFEGRRSEATVELYVRLSAGRGLLPPAVGFIFDREGRSDAVRADLARRGNVLFLARRMYENYLLKPAAIAAVAASIEDFHVPPPTVADVEAWLDDHRWDGRYFDPMPAEGTAEQWLSNVHGAKLLGDLFSQLSEQRVSYDKVRHGVGLTDWLLEHASEDLREVAQLITRGLPAAP